MAQARKNPSKPKPSKHEVPWWHTGIIYQIYIRSFYDSNGDGIGDLPGVTAKLDYLKDLGVDGIWLSPVTVSANADWGYDVVDYFNIAPELGTMKDFDKLIAEATKRNIQVLLDFVPNHTSVDHFWFQNALTGRDAQYRDYYIWADPKPGNKPPNNWKSWFGGSAWGYHKLTNQYFLHNFLHEQADLNWRNPEVKREFDEIIHFWLDKGISGFRIDVFNMLIKDQQLRDNPETDSTDSVELRVLGQRPVYTVSQPEVHEILRHWRRVVGKYRDRKLLLGETTMTYTVRQLAAFYGSQDELELAFNFNFLRAPFEANSLRTVVEETEDAIRTPDWPVWTASNHDESGRFSSRWAKGDERKIRCAMLMLLTLKGTPVLYYGDEIGLTSVWVAPWRIKDPWGKKYWPIFAGRDRARTPMPWKHQKGAGFTDTDQRPWLPYGNLAGKNVEEQAEDKDSTLRFTKAVISLRREHRDLQTGEYQSLPSPEHVWAYQRGKKFQVFINFSDEPQIVGGVAGVCVSSTLNENIGKTLKGQLELQPWQGVIIQL